MGDLQLFLVARLLRRGHCIERLSRPLTLMALITACLAFKTLAPGIILGMSVAVIALGLLQQYWAVRVALDADLFEALGQTPSQLATRTEVLDRALLALGLASPGQASDWVQRSRGALRLLRWQVCCCLAQWLLALFTATLLYLTGH